ncbi:MAG: hypothetical protein HQM03_00755, partial [Magnetococcales bacterium]|nr:hypothetical protein [Magnetococcales bacterium]
GRVEWLVRNGEEGFLLLSDEMNKEMDRIRRQIREAAGEVAVHARDLVERSGTRGEENLRELVGGVTEEVKSTLRVLEESRAHRDVERETLLLERLLTRHREQVDGVRDAVREELNETARRLDLAREESGREVVDLIAQRVEGAFGGVALELAEMRDRLAEERQGMENTLREWVQEASRTSIEENSVLERRIQEVRADLDERHMGIIGVIDQLGQGLEDDLDRLRDGLMHKNEESSQHVEQHLKDLGSLLEGVVTSLGREQAVFIEMLGERLDTLRRRLKVK